MTQPTYDLLNYRFFDDDGTGESDQTALGTGNNETLDRQTGTANRFCVRIELYNDNGKAGNEVWQWQYSYDSGAWTNITAASSVIRGYDSTLLTEDEDTTQRLTSNTPYLVDNNGVTEDGLNVSTAWGAGDYGEVLLSCYIVDADVADNKTIDIRVVEVGTDTVTYTNTPAITVDKAAAPISINLDTALLTANGQAITITPAAVSTELDTALLTANGKAITIVPGASTVTLDTALLTANGQAITITPSAVSTELDTALLTANGQAITIPITVNLDTALLTANGKAITITPSAASVSLGVASLTANGLVITIDAGASPVSINLDTALLTANGQAITITPSAVSTELDTALLTANGLAITITPSAASIDLDTALLTANGQAITITPSAASVSLDVATLTANGLVITIDAGTSPISIDLDTALLTANGQAITITPSAASVELDTALLTANGQAINIPIEVNLDTALLTANGKSITIIPGAASVSLGVASLTANGLAILVDDGAPSVSRGGPLAMSGLSGLIAIVHITGAAPAWLPTDIAGLKLWIDFSDISTLYQDSTMLVPVVADGDPIGAAEDKSGNGIDLTQTTTANKATYKTGIQNSLSIARLDGIDDFFFLTGVLPYTALAIISHGSVNQLEAIFANNSSNGTLRLRIGDPTKYKVETAGAGDFTHTGGNIYFDGVDTDTYNAGFNVMSAYHGNDYNDYMKIDRIGADEGSGRYMNCDIGEIIFYDNNISAADMTVAINGLNAKWSVF